MTVAPEEAAELIRLARRDIATAQTLTRTDLDWAFAIAYNALLQSSVAYMASLGYRSRSRDKHFVTFRFMREALPGESELTARLQRLRKKRNSTVYEHAGLVGESEALEMIEFAGRYIEAISDRLPPAIRELLESGEPRG
ncbi:MAG: HEPN domain-containing protein [Anaerosomatales bacterium]|nr:HEPN domain-containing protein [Anaerosomatales bacterium]MDT8434994.1 HEPN domain-containing protein [Anaerosomatales bacterium]